jgi:hypothetical protein
MNLEKVGIIVQVNDSVEGGPYWKSLGVTVLEEHHEVPNPDSIECIL